MENTNLSLRIKRLPYSRMLKSEMADYVEKTINIVDSHDHESDLITPVFALLNAKRRDIELLRLSYGIDTERLRLSKLKSELMLLISAFKLKVRLLSKSEPELDIHKIQNAINKHLRYLNKCRNDKELFQKIAGFFDLVESDEKFESSLLDFDLIDAVDIIQSTFSTMREVSINRVTMLSQRPTVSTKAIVKGMSEAVDNLFQSIEVANMITTLSEGQEPGETINLVPLIEELNQLSEMYSRSISIREANNKRKAEMKDDSDDDDDDENEPIEEPEEPEQPEEGGDTANMQTTCMDEEEDDS